MLVLTVWGALCKPMKEPYDHSCERVKHGLVRKDTLQYREEPMSCENEGNVTWYWALHHCLGKSFSSPWPYCHPCRIRGLKYRITYISSSTKNWWFWVLLVTLVIKRILWISYHLCHFHVNEILRLFPTSFDFNHSRTVDEWNVHKSTQFSSH